MTTPTAGKIYQTAEEAKARQRAQVEADRKREEHAKLKSEIGGLPSIRRPSIFTRPSESDEETASAVAGPSNRKLHRSPAELDTGNATARNAERAALPTPPASAIEREDETVREDVTELQAEIERQHDHIVALEDELKAEKLENDRLGREHSEARKTRKRVYNDGNAEEIKNLEDNIRNLVALLDDSEDRVEGLRVQVKKGKQREDDLEMQLGKAKRANEELAENAAARKKQSPHSRSPEKKGPGASAAPRKHQGPYISFPKGEKGEFRVPLHGRATR